ncbi:MAG: cupin domain-containing protein [Sphingobacteriales bacterium JAD_PAG50586_3]|nr:MAG: cupin domain-containing protein [Sphingobacteriales bacterium JAD_PAG50586_3]
MNAKIEELVTHLQLQPHPEGGYYKEVYRSAGIIQQAALGTEFAGDRNYCTGIYFLLTGTNFSAFHRIKSDELWHFYDGDTCNVYVIHLNGELEVIRLGRDIANGQVYQAVVPAGAWFASECSNPNGYSLTGCTVSPGFDFADFEMAERKSLTNDYPHLEDIITKLTRV